MIAQPIIFSVKFRKILPPDFKLPLTNQSKTKKEKKNLNHRVLENTEAS
jgi:hypothetical protein